MNGKIALVLLLGISFLFFGCAQPQAPEQPVVPPVTPPGGEEPVVGGDKDEHGCIGSAGYVWCEEKQKCIRPWEENCTEPLVGGDRDEHGCIGSAGYTWCEIKQKCVRVWEEPCVAGSLTLDEAKAIAENSSCMDEGKLGDTQMYNENTHTWWFDMDITKEGCAPACVVDDATKTAEINWRCTGLVPEETVEEPTDGSNVSEEQLAGLFQIEGEEPLGDEGLDTGTPSSNSS